MAVVASTWQHNWSESGQAQLLIIHMRHQENTDIVQLAELAAKSNKSIVTLPQNTLNLAIAHLT